MFEKVNHSHPDKIADRIAGAIVDLAYSKERNPRIAVEVLVGHGKCHIVAETSVWLNIYEIIKIVERITERDDIIVDYQEVAQDEHLARNQDRKIRCGDIGIFRGVLTSDEEYTLTDFVKALYSQYPYDGKFIIDEDAGNLIICQSNAKEEDIREFIKQKFPDLINNFDICINPLGEWTGGLDVDTGATNRKLGSDMGRAVTGGGIVGKDLSKADVSVNIYAHILAQRIGREVQLHCAIGDEYVDGLPYAAIVEIARDYIDKIGGFEKFAEWGLIR